MSNTINLTNKNCDYFLKVNNKIIVKYNNTFSLNEEEKDKIYGTIHINTIKLNITKDTNKEITIGTEGYIHIYINNQKNFNDFSFIISTNDEEYIFNYVCEKDSILKKAYGKTLSLDSDRASFMMLRTNPKLTGNIKLVIDSNNNMYLDTFEVNSTLSNKKYKHIQVSNLSNYANDIRNTFSGISKKELFEISPDNLNLFDTKKNISEQFVDTYFYGVKNNNNKLYSENFSLLAPLYINNELPDFFIVFKLNGATNNDIEANNATDRFKEFIKNGKIIKSFDLRKNTSIGDYLRKIVKDNNSHNTAVYISMSNDIPNQWSGISIDRGVIANINESNYFTKQIKNQVDYDRFVTNGFERNGLVNSHLINLEFMFDDEEGEDFSINRYFGLYVSNIQLETFSFNEKGNILIKNTNEEYNFNDFYNSFIKNNEDFIINITNDKNGYERIQSLNDLENYYKKITSNDNYNNVFSSFINHSDINKDNYGMLLNINNPLKCGEHLKIIDRNKKSVYEIIISKIDTEKYKTIEEYYNYENSPLVNYSNNITIYRNIAPGYEDIFNNNVNPFNEIDKKNIIKKQIDFILSSFKSILPEYINVSNNENSIYFSSNNNLIFERINADILYERIDDETEEDIYKSDITYFGNEIPRLLLKPSITNIELDEYILQPINFESWNNRYAYIVEFLNFNKDELYYDIPFEKYKEITNNSFIIIDKKQYKLKEFTLSYYINDNNGETNSIKNIKLLSNKNNNYLIKTSKESNINYNQIKASFYELGDFQLNISGIISVKDFNFNVLDNTNVFYHNNSYSKINGTDEYDEKYMIENNTLFTIEKLRNENKSCENIFNYFSLLEENKEYINSDAFINGVNRIYNSSKRQADIPLVTPTNCKWKLYGKDILNNKIKSTIFFDIIDTSNNYTSYRLNKDNKMDIFGFPSDSTKDKKLYISNSILNIIEDENGIKNSMRNDILYNGGSIYQLVDDPKKFVKCFYNFSNNSLEVIFFGQKIQFTTDKINLSEFDDYLFTMVCVPNTIQSTKNFELIFDKNNKTILALWYFTNGDTTLSGKKNNSASSNNFIKLNGYTSLENLYNNKNIPFNFFDKEITTKKYLQDKNIFLSAINENDFYSENNKKLCYEFKADVDNNIKSITGIFKESNELNNIISSFPDLIDDVSILSSTSNNVNTFLIDTPINLNEIYRNTNKFNYDTFTNVVKNAVDFFVINSNNVTTYKNSINIFFIEPIKKDKKYFIYDGYIQPDFIDIINFKNVDNIKIKEKTKNIYFSNLSIKEINNIKQIWHNKIYSNELKDASINDHNLLSLDYVDNFDITNSCWDDNFYKIYNKNGVKYVNGYESNKDIKTFFGSHALVLKTKEIIITNWENFYIFEDDIKEYNNYNDIKYKKVIKLNITKALLNYISTKTNIKNNWFFNQDAINYMKDYIINLIEKNYSINTKNIIKVFKREKRSSNTIVPFVENNSFIELPNVDIKLKKENEDYILNIVLPINNNEYAIKYKIEK